MWRTPTALQSGNVNRTHQLKALGNGIVPACAMPFALAIYWMLAQEES